MRFVLLFLSLVALAACDSVYYDDAGFAPPPDFTTQKDRDAFPEFAPNPVRLVSEQPVSTFSIDVDTVSYAFVRRALNEGTFPPRQAVRVEELINYFSYHYPRPKSADVPFRPTVVLYPTPWNHATRLLHIGIKGYDVSPAKRPRANLVFLIDVSGSMQSPDKLELVKKSLRMLVNELKPHDTIAMVVYAGAAGTVLEPTPVARKARILAALDRLEAGGSTAGAQGIRQAYALAEQGFDEEGVNRVILATDGDFNVGVSDPERLKTLIEAKRHGGIYLSVLGFGQGNYNDRIMQALAQNGNGNAAYIDTIREARKVLVDEATSTLFPIANDVKIQIEFNPAMVAEYRLIGYETRALKREDFNNDAVDAGDIGSGHTVTALYEITLTGSAERYIDELRYPAPAQIPPAGNPAEYAYIKLRYKLPGAAKSKRLDLAVTPEHVRDSIMQVHADIRFAASVAAFGQKLQNSPFVAGMSFEAIRKLAASAKGSDPYGYRAEFLSLVGLASTMSRQFAVAGE